MTRIIITNISFFLICRHMTKSMIRIIISVIRGGNIIIISTKSLSPKTSARRVIVSYLSNPMFLIQTFIESLYAIHFHYQVINRLWLFKRLHSCSSGNMQTFLTSAFCFWLNPTLNFSIKYNFPTTKLYLLHVYIIISHIHFFQLPFNIVT